MLAIAVAWTVYGINHRPFDLGLVGLAIFLPQLLLVFVTGQAADKYNRKTIVILAAIGLAFCAFGFAAMSLAGIRNLPLMLVVLLCQGVVRAYGSPAERSVLPNIVEPGTYIRVQARYSSLREIVIIGAPALGGALLAISEPVTFVVAGIMTVAAVIAFSLVHVPATIRPANAPLNAGSAMDGVRFMMSRPIVLGAISLDLFAVLFGGAVALLPVYADQILHAGSIGLGFLRSSSGIGASLMAIFLSSRPPSRHVGRTMLAGVTGFGLATAVFGFSHNIVLSVIALAAAGACDMISVVIRRGLVQLNTPDDMRGRVNAIEAVFIGGSGQLGAFESGTAAQLLGPVRAVVLGGFVTVLIVIAWAKMFPALLHSDRLVEAPVTVVPTITEPDGPATPG